MQMYTHVCACAHTHTDTPRTSLGAPECLSTLVLNFQLRDLQFFTSSAPNLEILGLCGPAQFREDRYLWLLRADLTLCL